MSLVHTQVLPGIQAFLPTSIAGCQLWLDASDASTITLNGGAGVSPWNDKSGNARNMSQATGANQPAYITAAQNGRNVVRFTRTAPHYMLNASAAALRSVAGWTFFQVRKPSQNAITTVTFVVGSGSAAQRMQMVELTTGQRAGGRRNNADALETTANATPPPIAWQLITATGDFTNTDLTLYIAGSQVSQNTAWLTAGSTPNDEGGLWVGINSNLGSPFDGDIGEIVMYDSVLSGGNRGTVESYLTAKWGL